jgi:hypothetical protein
MSNLTDNSLGHSLYLPKTVPNALLVTATKWDINLSHSWLYYNWRTKATTDDLHHHCSMQVKRDDHTFSSKNCMETKVHPQKQKSGHHFTYLDNYIIQRRMNKQSRFNAEQIDKDKYPESKNRLKIKSKITSRHNKTKNHLIIKSTSYNKRRLHISQCSPISS